MEYLHNKKQLKMIIHMEQLQRLCSIGVINEQNRLKVDLVVYRKCIGQHPP